MHAHPGLSSAPSLPSPRTCHGWQPDRVWLWPMIHRERRARVNATFMRRTSDKKPTPPLPPLCALHLQHRSAHAHQ